MPSTLAKRLDVNHRNIINPSGCEPVTTCGIFVKVVEVLKSHRECTRIELRLKLFVMIRDWGCEH